MLPGTHIALIAKNETSSLLGRSNGWELRDTLLVLAPGPTAFYVHLFRVPLEESTVAQQVLKTGTGALNIDPCRVPTSSTDAEAMGRCNTPGSGRMYASSSPIGTFTRSSSSGALDTKKGRWPSNLLLVHHPECERKGTKKVKACGIGSIKGRTGKDREGQSGTAYGAESRKAGTPMVCYADSPDGTETVVNWECVEGCPVASLDRQSGLSTSSSDPLRFSSTPKYKGTHYARDAYSLKMGRPIAQAYGDTGGASRYYPQFASVKEVLDWITSLII